jgi:hypothetical protein
MDVFENLKVHILETYKDSEDLDIIKRFVEYLKYDRDCNEFVVNFNDVWKWCDFARKADSKKVLIKKFKENKDYIIEKDLNENKFDKVAEIIKLTIDCFINFSLRAGKEKAKKINNLINDLYHIKTEYINKINAYNEDLITTHNKIANEFLQKSGCYIGIINRKETDGYTYYKLGSTNNITEREIGHNREFDNKLFYRYFYQADKYIKLEKIMKNHSIFVKGKIPYEGHIEVFKIKNEDAEKSIRKLLDDSVKRYEEYILSCDPKSLPYMQEITKQKELDNEKEIRLAEIQERKDIRLAEINQDVKLAEINRDIKLSELLNERLNLQIKFEEEKNSILKRKLSL